MPMAARARARIPSACSPGFGHLRRGLVVIDEVIGQIERVKARPRPVEPLAHQAIQYLGREPADGGFFHGDEQLRDFRQAGG